MREGEGVRAEGEIAEWEKAGLCVQMSPSVAPGGAGGAHQVVFLPCSRGQSCF